jgi:hypothetical protein
MITGNKEIATNILATSRTLRTFGKNQVSPRSWGTTVNDEFVVDPGERFLVV